MNTNKITELNASGFNVSKTKDVNTIIEHSAPFKLVREGKDDYAVPLNEDTGTYAVTIGGYPSDDTIDYNVVQYSTPLIFELNESAKLTVEDVAIASDNEIKVELQDAVFESISVNTEFYKSNDSTTTRFVKVDETSYVKAGNTIGSAIALIAEATDVMFTEMYEDAVDMLSDEQKQDVVDHAPAGLDVGSFAEYVGHDLENIPGLEALDDAARDTLVKELTQMYFSK